ncbi:MAG TPA: mycofactocin biosynthesis glycosyltransferase MftF [Pseudolysinimonas sp.]|nr:mycofactocin biosynthesis glycosyltransferase MftF [Pseudolysinimonas sp.]
MTGPSMPLPLGFVVRLSDSTRVADDGVSLIGGSPTRVIFLTPAAAALLVDGRVTVTDRRSSRLADYLLDIGMADPVVADLPPGDPALVSYVVPVRDRATSLDRLLASIPSQARTVVVDDASLDPAAIARVSRRRGAEFVPLRRNIGPAGARNAGLRLVRTPFVAFVDSDVVLVPGAIELMLRHFADPRLAIVAPRVAGMASSGMGAAARRTWISRYEDARSSLDLGDRPAAVRPRSAVPWVSSTTLLARVDALGAGFDDRMRSGEDVDLVWRLAESGHRIRYEPSARVLHEHRGSAVAWAHRKFVYGTSAAALAERHPDAIAPAIIAPWGVALLAALLAQRRWSLPVAGVIAGGMTWRIAARLPRSRHPVRVAARLTATGVATNLGQGSALLMRHWWPLTLALLPFSRRLRRVVLVAHIADTVLEHRRTGSDLDPVRFGLARRLDDLAYGAGVWFSALRAGSLRALIPEVRKRPPEA